VVDSYTISYTRNTDQCRGTVGFELSHNISGLNGSVTSYVLTNLEEDSVFNITIEAVNGAGRATSPVFTIRTSAAGMITLQSF